MHSTRARHTRVAAAALGLALGTLVLAGCGGGAAPTASAPSAAASSAAASEGTVVEVTMTEFALEFSQQSFTPGTYTFKAPNEGQFPHTISITGPGVENATAGGPAQTGQEVSTTVDLQPGTYKVWCPVRDHEARGMVSEITVAWESANAGQSCSNSEIAATSAGSRLVAAPHTISSSTTA